ncbi:Maf family protein [Candidatus Dependentiae bacterium]
MKNILHLASSSISRRRLLEESKIPHKIIPQSSKEPALEGASATEQVLHLAKDKMMFVDMTHVDKSKPAFIVTADSLVEMGHSKQIFGKPKDLEDSKYMMKAMRKEPVNGITGCVLEKRESNGKIWQTVETECWTSMASAEFHIPEGMEEEFIKQMPDSVKACGSAIIEEYGQQFCKSISGSYTAFLGLPMYDLRTKLESMEFWKNHG